jgi:hypothetical protein
MRSIVKIMCEDPIDGIPDVRFFFRKCVNELELGKGFHPDTDFEDYVIIGGQEEGKRFFTDEEAKMLNDTMSDAFEECKNHGVDIYEIALEITNKSF